MRHCLCSSTAQRGRYGQAFDTLLERRRRDERTLTTVVAARDLFGVSMRRMVTLVETAWRHEVVEVTLQRGANVSAIFVHESLGDS